MPPGFDFGDYVLVSLADLFRTLIRKHDAVSRWGGEEFLIFLPETEYKEGMIIASRFRETIASHTFEFNKISEQVTMSLGVNLYDSLIDIDESIKEADNRLYRAKKDGRNRVVGSD